MIEHSSVFLCISSQYFALPCIALYFKASTLHCIVLHCLVLHCIVLLCLVEKYGRRHFPVQLRPSFPRLLPSIQHLTIVMMIVIMIMMIMMMMMQNINEPPYQFPIFIGFFFCHDDFLKKDKAAAVAAILSTKQLDFPCDETVVHVLLQRQMDFSTTEFAFPAC